MVAVHILGLVSIGIFYILILAIGIWAGRKAGKGGASKTSEDEVFLAGRNIGLFVGVFTMTATWVGGGYINGTSEYIYGRGLLWCQAPIGYSLSLVFGGLFFAEKMREAGYVTMLDPFQKKYGERVGGLLFIPALMGEIFWSAAILSSLGATISVVVETSDVISISISALIAVAYTLFGGLYSVAYTDVIQLACILVGLVLAVPFIMTNSAVKNISDTQDEWLGSIKPVEVGEYVDSALLLICGGIPWQVYFQRVLSSKTARRAKLLSFVAAIGCILMAIPPVLIGAAAKSADWKQTTWDGNSSSIPAKKQKLVLPMTLMYLCPKAVTFFGLGAVSAAVMSSADSSILSAASMFSRNIYRLIFRKGASEREIIWVIRIAIVGVGGIATVLAIQITSVYELWFLSSDMVYVLLFPQIICVVYYKGSNTYGALAGFIMGLFIRLASGETLIKFPALFQYPGYDPKTYAQIYPYKTIAMCCTLISIFVGSAATKWLFESGRLPASWDILHCVVNIQEDNANFKNDGKALTDDKDKYAIGYVNEALKHSGVELVGITKSSSVVSAISEASTTQHLLKEE